MRPQFRIISQPNCYGQDHRLSQSSMLPAVKTGISQVPAVTHVAESMPDASLDLAPRSET